MADCGKKTQKTITISHKLEPAKIKCHRCVFYVKSIRKGRKIYDIIKRFTLEFDSRPARINGLDNQYNCSTELAS